MLAPGRELGRIWALSRPLTYRAIERLVEKGLITPRRSAPGGAATGSCTPLAGRSPRRDEQWIDTPVDHLRDLRTQLLVELALLAPAGLDNEHCSPPSRQLFEPKIDALTSGEADDDLVDLWRRESARAVRRFLGQALQPAPAGRRPPRAAAQRPQPAPRDRVRRAPRRGDGHGQGGTGDGQSFTAAITKDAAPDLDLAPGDPLT